MAASESATVAAPTRDFTPELLHLMMWAGFLLLVLSMLAPSFFSISVSDEIVQRGNTISTNH